MTTIVKATRAVLKRLEGIFSLRGTRKNIELFTLLKSLFQFNIYDFVSSIKKLKKVF